MPPMTKKEELALRSELERHKLQAESYAERLTEKDQLIERLLVQIDKLQEALVSKEAPAAWYQHQSEKYEANKTEDDIKEEREDRERQKTVDAYLREMESEHIISSPDDLNDKFLSLMLAATEPESIHDNTES